MSKYNMVCAGIDTGKRKLDVALYGSQQRLQIDNTPEGHAVLLEWLRKHRVKRVGIEASGGYEQMVVTTLRKHRVVVIVFQPAQVRAYATFHLQRAKNDKIDAALIADCTAAAKKIHEAPDPRLAAFAQHLTFLEQLGEDINRLKNRCETCHDPRQLAFWKSEIARLKKLKKAELTVLVRGIRQHKDLAERLDLIASVDTVGVPTRSAFSCACPRSVASAASRRRLWPASPLMTMTAESTPVTGISMVADSGCERRSTQRLSLAHSTGTRSSKPSTSASSPTAKSTKSPSSPARENSSSTSTPSSPAKPLGSPNRRRPNGCYFRFKDVKELKARRLVLAA
jgi:Transposase